MAAIIDYDTLKSTVQSYCARTDSTFTARMPVFVGLAEDRLYNGHGEPGEPLYSPPVRSRPMEATGTITITDGVGALPGDYLSMRKLFRPGDDVGLTYLAPERMAITGVSYPSGVPMHYTTEGDFLKLTPQWSGDLTVLYYKRHPEVSATSITGPLIVAHGLAYLEATLIEAFSFLQDGENAVGHAAKLRGLVSGINRSATDLRYSGPLRVRQRQWIP